MYNATYMSCRRQVVAPPGASTDTSNPHDSFASQVTVVTCNLKVMKSFHTPATWSLLRGLGLSLGRRDSCMYGPAQPAVEPEVGQDPSPHLSSARPRIRPV